MLKKLFLALFILACVSVFAEEFDENSEKLNTEEGVLVERYIQEYIDLPEAEKLEFRSEAPETQTTQNHEKIEKPTVIKKSETK